VLSSNIPGGPGVAIRSTICGDDAEIAPLVASYPGINLDTDPTAIFVAPLSQAAVPLPPCFLPLLHVLSGKVCTIIWTLGQGHELMHFNFPRPCSVTSLRRY